MIRSGEPEPGMQQGERRWTGSHLYRRGLYHSDAAINRDRSRQCVARQSLQERAVVAAELDKLER